MFLFVQRIFISSLRTTVGEGCVPLTFKWFSVSVQMSFTFKVQLLRNLEMMRKMDPSPPMELLTPACRAPGEFLIFGSLSVESKTLVLKPAELADLPQTI